MQNIPYDVYNDFPEYLNLTDLRSFCQAHPRFCQNPLIKNKLSMVYHDTHDVLSYLRHHYIIIQPTEYLKFGIVHDIMKHIGIYEPVDEDDENNRHPSDIQNDLYIVSITINKINNYTFIIRYENYNAPRTTYANQNDFDVTTFYCHHFQLKEFLLQMFYNDFIIKATVM